MDSLKKIDAANGDQVLSYISEHRNKDIFGAGSMLKKLVKAVPVASPSNINANPSTQTQGDTPTNQGVSMGVKPHLLDKMAARDLHDFNPTHAACLTAKRDMTVGLGHRDQTIHDILDPLCRFSWQDLLTSCGDDYFETGECFIECVYDDTDPELIVALNHIESAQVSVEVEEQDNAQDWHFLVRGEDFGIDTMMARFGDLEDLKKRYKVTDLPSSNRSSDSATPSGGLMNVGSTANGNLNANDARIRKRSTASMVNSAIIHIRQPNNRSRWYGFPDYLSAVPSIELVQCMTQHEFDFFFNRGVPEFMLFIIGKNMGTEAWKKITAMIEANRGLGNSHKTGAVHLPGSKDEIAVQVEKLAMEDSGQNGFADKSMALAMAIATSHGVPPVLANILLAGKIGAANETPNALLLLQKGKLGQAQRNFSVCLAQTLGSGVKLAQPQGAPATLTRDQFLGGAAPAPAAHGAVPGKPPPPFGAQPKPVAAPTPQAQPPGAPAPAGNLPVNGKVPVGLAKAFPPAMSNGAAGTNPFPPHTASNPTPTPGAPGAPPPHPGMPQLHPLTGQPMPPPAPTDANGMPIHKQPGNGFNTVLDGMTLGAQNTMASMQDPMATSTRSPADGLLTSNSDRLPGDPNKKPGK